jgi:hypothetical protein
MQEQRGFWDVENRLEELSRQGDPLEKLPATVDFKILRPALDEALGSRDAAKGRRPPFVPVLKFRMLVRIYPATSLGLEASRAPVGQRRGRPVRSAKTGPHALSYGGQGMLPSKGDRPGNPKVACRALSGLRGYWRAGGTQGPGRTPTRL